MPAAPDRAGRHAEWFKQKGEAARAGGDEPARTDHRTGQAGARRLGMQDASGLVIARSDDRGDPARRRTDALEHDEMAQHQASLRAKRSNPACCAEALDCFLASLVAMTFGVG